MDIELVSGLDGIRFKIPVKEAKQIKKYLDEGREFTLLFPDYEDGE